MHFFNTLACTKIADISESIGVNDTFKAPPFLCTEAVFGEELFIEKCQICIIAAIPPAKELAKYEPTELMLNVQ